MLEYKQQDELKQHLKEQLASSENQLQESELNIKKIKIEYDQLLISKNEDHKNVNQINYLQDELDKTRNEVRRYCMQKD